MSIIRNIEEGIIRTACEYTVVENRKEAIEFALSKAKKNDVILVAGKGHEDYQEIHGVRFRFNDKEIVEEYYTRLDAEPKAE